jgi:glycosyltransferase involved in cell wall biosynthesis
VARKANAVTAIATHLRDDLRNRGIPETKLFVVPNGVDTTKFIPRSTDENLRAELAFNGDICLGYLGSLYPWEGVDDLLNAMVIVARQNPAIKLLIVGGGEEHARLKSMVDAQGLGHCVRMQGQIPHADVLRYYSIMDVMVYPRKRSRVTELVTPLKPLEAMAMSKPIVATDVGGLRELLGENGTVYCNADDPNDLAMKCLQLVNAGATERERLGAIGKRYVAENKSWLKIATLYDAVYEFAKQHRVS